MDLAPVPWTLRIGSVAGWLRQTAASAAELSALGQLIGGFGATLNGSQLGALLGGFGGTAQADVLGPVLGGFGDTLTASQLGSLLGGFGGSVTATDLGRLLGGFGAGLSSSQLGSLLGGFGGAITGDALGVVLGGYGAVAPTDAQLGSLLGAFGNATTPASTFSSLLGVAQAFGGSALTATQIGSVLGGFGATLGTGNAVVLGTLLGGFGTGTSTISQLGSLLGGFGNTVTSSQLTALGQLIGGFGATLGGNNLGILLEALQPVPRPRNWLWWRVPLSASSTMPVMPPRCVASLIRCRGTSWVRCSAVSWRFRIDAQLNAVLAGSSGQLTPESWTLLQTTILDYAGGRINATQLNARLADLATDLSPSELGIVLRRFPHRLDALQFGQVVAGLATSLNANAAGNLLSGYVDARNITGLQTLLSAFRTTIVTGAGDDVVSGVVLTTLRTQGGNDYLFAGTVDATAFLQAFAQAGFSLPTSYAALSVSGAELDGGLGNDTYHLIGEQLGHLKLTEPSAADNDTSVDTLDLSGFGGGAVTLDLARIVEQTVQQGELWLTISDAAGFETVVGTSQADVIRGNARDNTLSGSDPLDDRAACLACGRSRPSTCFWTLTRRPTTTNMNTRRLNAKPFAREWNDTIEAQTQPNHGSIFVSSCAAQQWRVRHRALQSYSGQRGGRRLVQRDRFPQPESQHASLCGCERVAGWSAAARGHKRQLCGDVHHDCGTRGWPLCRRQTLLRLGPDWFRHPCATWPRRIQTHLSRSRRRLGNDLARNGLPGVGRFEPNAGR